jgi:hypothetical protein
MAFISIIGLCNRLQAFFFLLEKAPAEHALEPQAGGVRGRFFFAVVALAKGLVQLGKSP